MKRVRRFVMLMFEAGTYAAGKVSDHYFRQQEFELALIWQRRAEWCSRRAGSTP